MTAHGTDPDAVDVEVFNDICVMYADGIIGNRGIIETLGALTAGIYNYLRPEGKKPYTLQDIIPRAYDYYYPPLSKEEQQQQTQENLKAFLLSKAPVGMFKDKL